MRKAGGQSGFVLVSVLWVLALLTVVTLSYGYRARLEVQAARYRLDSGQARMAARAAVERGILELQNKHLADQAVVVGGRDVFAPSTHFGQPWARGGDLYKAGGALTVDATMAADRAEYTIEDLEGRVSLNTAPEVVVEALPGVSLAVARRLNHRRSEATPFADPVELRGIDGISEKDWVGGPDTPGLRELVTVHGDGRINVNTATEAVLAHLPEVGEGLARDILEARNGADGESGTADDMGWTGWDDFSVGTGITGAALQPLQRLCKFDSTYFKITGVATRRGGRIISTCQAVARLTDNAGEVNVLSWSEDSLGAQ